MAHNTFNLLTNTNVEEISNHLQSTCMNTQSLRSYIFANGFCNIGHRIFGQTCSKASFSYNNLIGLRCGNIDDYAETHNLIGYDEISADLHECYVVQHMMQYDAAHPSQGVMGWLSSTISTSMEWIFGSSLVEQPNLLVHDEN